MPYSFKLALVLAAVSSAPALASPRASQAAIAAEIKADVATIVAGINSKDIDKATRFDAPDLISMESMRTPSYGAKANHDGLSMVFQYEPNWRLTLIDETVDVSRSGDMAIYRSTYSEDSMRGDTPFTHKVNYIAGFRRDGDGKWRIHWSVVCAQSPSKKK
jgi:ketosteroid isomerase-like protein